MGCCGTLSRILGFALIPLIASLVYFHLECLEEEKNRVKPQFNEKFDLQATDIKTEMFFNIKGQKIEVQLGFIHHQGQISSRGVLTPPLAFW